MTKRHLALILVVGTMVAACERVAPVEDRSAPEGEGEEAPALTPVDTPPPEPEQPVLAGIAYADIAAELEPGAGCHVEVDGKNLLTAVDGDAIARPYGTVRHFAFAPAKADESSALDNLWGGGTFTAGAITIRVTPAEGEGVQYDEVTVRDAQVRFSEEGQPEPQTLAATWHCGS